MAKYFFFDIDNTLAVGTSKVVPPDSLSCLRQLKTAGHFVGIATGRLQCDAAAFAEKLQIDSFVADGGQSLTWHNQIIEMDGLPREKCLALFNELDRLQLPWAVTPENKLVRYSRSPKFESGPFKNYYKTVVCPVEAQTLKHIFKIFAARPNEGDVEPDWQGLPKIPYFHNTYLIEPTDKAAGIRRMVRHLGGQLEDVVVFGDGLNDLTMFSSDWFSIAMGNAKPQLKEKADYITGDCDKGGILAACKKFNWI